MAITKLFCFHFPNLSSFKSKFSFYSSALNVPFAQPFRRENENPSSPRYQTLFKIWEFSEQILLLGSANCSCCRSVSYIGNMLTAPKHSARIIKYIGTVNAQSSGSLYLPMPKLFKLVLPLLLHNMDGKAAKLAV